MFHNDSCIAGHTLLCSVREEHSITNMNSIPEDLTFINHNDSLVKSRITASDDLGPMIGVLITLMIYSAINIEVFNVYTILYTLFESKAISRAVVLIILLFFSPIIIALTLLASLYKVACFFILRIIDENFESFLDGFDVFWSLEEGDIRNIIHVLGIIESRSSVDLINKIRENLNKVALNECSSKIFYRRNEKCGWYYWKRYKNVDIDEYVQLIDVGRSDLISRADLEKYMTNVCNRPLPFNNEGLFQILITKQKIVDSQPKVANNYGIVFRIDHAVGDGVALIEFLCHALVDKVDDKPANLFSLPTSNNSEKPADLLDTVKQLCSAPICFADGILRKPDENSLHGPNLCGEKVFKSTDLDEGIFQMVKDIKRCNKNLNFSDILAISMSSGLRNYFLKTMDHVPENVAVILPVRLSKIENEMKLKNNFTVTILDLPTKEERPIKEIQRRTKSLRKSIDPMVNHYFLKLCYLLPKQILRPLFYSTQATLVFSNMPGPDSILSICGGSLIKSLVFFVPNKGNTGLGLSALYYGGVLRFAAMADSSLVSTPEVLSLILDSMVEEIRQLHSIYVN